MASKREPLTLEDREDISRGLAKGLENKDIASSIGRDESVVSREIARHGGREAYRAWKADTAARESRSRPKERKIDTDPGLREQVAGDLRKGWSPEEIAGRLCYELSRGETGMSVSHEAIYTWIYAQPKDDMLRPACGWLSWKSGIPSPVAHAGGPPQHRRTIKVGRPIGLGA